MFQLLFLFTFSYLEWEVAGIGSSIISRLPNTLQELCPGAKVCQENLTSHAPERIFRSGYGSCCTDCSCSSDCEERGNCCFPHDLSSKQRTDDGTNTAEATSTCLFPATSQPENRRLYQSYSMISMIPKSIGGHKRIQSNISCGDENVAPWGSLYPVYSAKQKRIYKNIACADADGVTDGKPWDAVLVCSKTNQDTGSFVTWSDSNSFSEKCKVNFIYQGKSKDIQSLICYSDLINTCLPLDEFEITNELNISKKNVIELCTSGLVSPYRAKNMYANIFCHICNDESFRREWFCSKIRHVSARRPSNRGFVALIDGNFIAEDRRKSISGAADVQVACTVVQNDKCRPVFCPSGQLRSRDGECIYPNTAWYDQEYTMYIKLKSDKPIDVYEVFQVPALGKSLKLPAFKSPWSNNWYIDSVYSEMVEGVQSSTTLVVIQKNKVRTVQPKYFMQNIRRTITKDWLLETSNVTLVLKSSFMPFTTAQILLYTPPTFFPDLTQSLVLPGYRQLYKIRNGPNNELHVTDLYLCNQVELIEPEFTLSQNQQILFNKMTKRYLLNGEFTLVSSSNFVGIRARICIEESGLYETEDNIISGTGAVSELDLCLLFAMTLLILI